MGWGIVQLISVQRSNSLTIQARESGGGCWGQKKSCKVLLLYSFIIHLLNLVQVESKSDGDVVLVYGVLLE